MESNRSSSHLENLSVEELAQLLAVPGPHPNAEKVLAAKRPNDILKVFGRMTNGHIKLALFLYIRRDERFEVFHVKEPPTLRAPRFKESSDTEEADIMLGR